MSSKRAIHALALAAGGLLATAGGPGMLPALDLESGSTTLVVTVGKSLVLDNALNIQRISLANGDLAEAVAVNPREVLINGKAPGDTTLIVWQQGGPRLTFDLRVRPSRVKLDDVRAELARELPGQDITVYIEGANVFLHGTAKDMVSADRAAEVAATLGKVINLLHVVTPPEEAQILLKVRFADVDRTATTQLGMNLFSLGATNTIGGVTTQQFSPPQVQIEGGAQATFTNALNVFLFRPDLNLGATIEALEARNMLEILAEPNVLAMNGKPASFLSGGQFPVPVVQGGANIGAVTIMFKEFGVRLNFLPIITPRGTIRLKVAPEVSTLDYSNAVVLQGFTVPAIATRKMQTEIELESGQSFAIAGLLDNRFNDTIDKVPGIGDIPILGKLFQSRNRTKSNSELLVMVTPELVRPIPAGRPGPQVPMPGRFLPGTLKEAPRTPGIAETGTATSKPQRETVPLEEMQDLLKKEKDTGVGGDQMMPAPQPMPAPAAPSTGTGSGN